MTALDIVSLFPKELVTHTSPFFFYDGSYARPTTDWLLGKFYPWWKKDREARGLKYGRKSDCDNFARAFCVAAQDAHAESTHSDEAATVGEFLYIGSTHVKGSHAIVAAITEQGLIFVEPQTGQQLTLTPGEIASAYRITF